MNKQIAKDEVELKRVVAYFYRLPSGRMPVHEWLRNMDKVDRHAIGRELKQLEYGWPMGMPICRPMGDGLFELRDKPTSHCAGFIFCGSNAANGSIAWFYQEDPEISTTRDSFGKAAQIGT